MGVAGGIPEWSGRGVHEAMLQSKYVCKDLEAPSYRALARAEDKEAEKAEWEELEQGYPNATEGFGAPHEAIS